MSPPSRSSRGRRRWQLVSFGIALAAMARPAGASPAESPQPAEATPAPAPPAAVKHYERGLELYDAGDIEGALRRFERAYTLSGNHRLLFNIGQLYYELRRLARSRTALERYLEEGGRQIPEARRERVQRQLAELSVNTGVLTLHLDGAPVQLEIQGRHVTTAVKAPRFVVDAGLVRVLARRAGLAPVEHHVRVDGGQAQHLSFEFVRTPAPARDAAPRRPSTAALVWTVSGALGAVALGTGIATVLTSNHNDELTQTRADSSPQRYRDDLDRQRERVETLALATDVLAVATLSGALLGVFLSLNDSDERPRTLALGPGQLRVTVGF